MIRDHTDKQHQKEIMDMVTILELAEKEVAASGGNSQILTDYIAKLKAYLQLP